MINSGKALYYAGDEIRVVYLELSLNINVFD